MADFPWQGFCYCLNGVPILVIIRKNGVRVTANFPMTKAWKNGDDGIRFKLLPKCLLEGALRLRRVFLDSFRGLTGHDQFSYDEDKKRGMMLMRFLATAIAVYFCPKAYGSWPIFRWRRRIPILVGKPFIPIGRKTFHSDWSENYVISSRRFGKPSIPIGRKTFHSDWSTRKRI